MNAAALFKKYLFFAKKFRLQILFALLVLLYFAAAPKNEKFFERAFLTSMSEADKIEMSEPGRGSLSFSKCGSFWLGEFYSEEGESQPLFFCCDKSLVEKLLYNLQRKNRLYEISGSKDAKSAYGLRQDCAFSLKIRRKSEVILSLNFGSVDSKKRIFICVDNDTKISSTDSTAFAPYLALDANFWAAPEIFPKDIVGAEKKYRHGKLAVLDGRPLKADDFDWTGAAEKDFDPGDGNFYRAYFLQRTDGDYCFRFEALPSAQRPSEEKAALKKINAVFLVSAWTFEKVFEED